MSSRASESFYTYDNLPKDRRLKQITNEAQDLLVSDFFYAYQSQGEIYKVKRKLPAISEDVLVYDAADQLTYATLGTTNSYVYDAAGNRTQEVIAGAQTDFVYNNNVNELTSRSGAQGSATFPYDPNGSLTSDGTRTFDWDGANRLVAVNIGTHRSEFSYDGIGRRTRIVEKDNSVVTSDKRYVWCGGEICEERDASGGTVLKRFFDQGVQESATSFYYTRDHLGSIRERTDIAGASVARYDYDPWGRQTKLSGSQDAAFGYAGYFVHQPSGLLLTWYRAYEPSLARWISRDPIEEEGGINLYAYVENAPILYNDPQGLILLICYRRGWDQTRGVTGLLKTFTQHSYFYWPSPDGNPDHDQQCGRYKGKPVPEHPRTEDPKNTVCLPVRGSEGKEAAMIDCCQRKNKEKRPYIPVGDDCQTDTTNCLKKGGMNPPPGNPGRFRSPWQSVRDNNKGTPYRFP
jgi:RHS repeat-associated protein